MITRVQRLSIPVSNQDRAKRFYMEILGMELVNDVPLVVGDLRTRWVELAPRGGGPTLVLVTGTPLLKPGALDGVMFETPDVDAECRSLERRGVVVDGPHETPWGRQAGVRDPDGNRVLLVEAEATGPYCNNWLAHRYTTVVRSDP